MRGFTVSILALALVGCAQGPSLQSQMSAYVGSSEANLVLSLGVPDKQVTVNGVKYLAYVRQQAQVESYSGSWGGPWRGYWGPYYAAYYNPGFPNNIYVWSCEVTFQVQNDKVYNVTLKGNYCQ
jgi:hypothetical protein